MAKDYAKAKAKTEAPNAAKSLSQTLAMWLSTILLIFLFALGLFFLSHQEQLNGHKTHSVVVRKEQKPQPQQVAQKSNKPRFEFYNLLTSDKTQHHQPAQTNERAKEDEQAAQAERAPGTTVVETATPTVDHFFYLQVASFQSNADAETMKAKLALAGYAVTIKRTQIRNRYWHRVYIGPYSNKGDAAAAQATLKRYRLKGLIRSELI